jgi:hypothetical protein
MRIVFIALAATALGACAGLERAGNDIATDVSGWFGMNDQTAVVSVTGEAEDYVVRRSNDPTRYTAFTLDQLAQQVREGTLDSDTAVEFQAPIDARFARQIVIDLRTGEGQVVSRRRGDCLQVLLPFQIDQEEFDTGKYFIRGTFRRQWLPDDGFNFELNRYDPACGDAYLVARALIRVE